MCWGPDDKSGEIARAAESERQRNIDEGTARVNSAFTGFNDDFYNSRAKDYSDFYLPQLEQQKKDANSKIVYDLARGGNLDSSIGAKTIGDFTQKYIDAKGQVAEGAQGAAQQARGDVEQNRSDLIRLLQGGAGIEDTATSANARVQQLTQPPAYSPLVDLFANFTGQLANSAALQSQGYPGIPITQTKTSSPSSSVVSVTR